MRQLDEWELERIENTFRIINNSYNCKDRKTCLDRDIMLCWNIVYNALHDKENSDTLKYRLRAGQTPYNDDDYPDIRETKEYQDYQKELDKEMHFRSYDSLEASEKIIVKFKETSPKEYGISMLNHKKKK